VESGTVSAITKVPRALAERRANLAIVAAALGSATG
jgi:hypothetical protein